MRLAWSRRAIVFAASAVLAGCASTPVKYYPKFPEQMKSLGKIVVLQDVFLAEDAEGDTSKIDLLWNRQLADSLLLYCKLAFERRGLPPERLFLASIGMPLNSRSMYGVVSKQEDAKLGIGSLPKAAPPYYLDPEIDTSVVFREQWQRVCRSLVHTSFTPEANHTFVEGADSIGERLGASTLCIFFASGIIIPVTQRVIPESPSINNRIGQVSEERATQASMSVFMINASTGELLWSDQQVLTGGTIYQGKLTLLIERLVDRLP